MSMADRVRIAVVCGTAVLIALAAAWILSGGLSPARLLIAVGATLPLLLLLPSLQRGDRRRYAVMTLCIIPYLVVALTELIANPGARIWAGSVMSLTFALFVASIAYLRVSRSA